MQEHIHCAATAIRNLQFVALTFNQETLPRVTLVHRINQKESTVRKVRFRTDVIRTKVWPAKKIFRRMNSPS